MKPSIDPERLSLAAYPFVREIATRVGDLDGYGHLNAIRIGGYYEDARAAFYGVAEIRPRESRLLVAQITLRYLGEGFWPDPVQVGTGIGRIGGASCEMVQALFQRARCIGLCETVLVNTADGGSAPLPAQTRGALERLILGAAADA